MSFYQAMRKSEYLMSPGLYEYYYNFNKWKSVFALHGIFFLITSLLSEYPDLLISIDVAIVISALIFRWLGRPLIMRGYIPAYYSKDYKKGILFPLFFTVAPYVYFGAYIRSVVMFLFYAASLLLTMGNDREFQHYVNEMRWNVTNVDGILIGLLLFLLQIYVLHYHDRFISIKDFSNRSMQLVLERKMHIDMAMETVLRNREKELEMKALGNVKYDGNYKDPLDEIREEIARQQTKYSQAGNGQSYSYKANKANPSEQPKKDVAYTQIRRQARD